MARSRLASLVPGQKVTAQLFCFAFQRPGASRSKTGAPARSCGHLRSGKPRKRSAFLRCCLSTLCFAKLAMHSSLFGVSWCAVSPETVSCVLLRVVFGELASHVPRRFSSCSTPRKPTVRLQLFPRPPTPWAFQDVTKQLRPLLCTGPLLLFSCFGYMLLLPLCCYLRYGHKVTAQLSASLSKTGCFPVEDRSPGTELRTPAFRQAEKKGPLSYTAVFQRFVSPSSPRTVAFWCFRGVQFT